MQSAWVAATVSRPVPVRTGNLHTHGLASETHRTPGFAGEEHLVAQVCASSAVLPIPLRMSKKNKKNTAEDASQTGSACACLPMPERQIPRLMLSIDEVTVATGIGRDLLYVHLRTGALPSVQMGRRRLVRVADLQAWVERLPATAA